MTRMARRIVVAVLMLVVIGAFSAPAEGASRPDTEFSSSARRAWLGGPGHRLHRGPNGAVNVDVCSQSVGPGVAQCYARARTDLFDRDVRPDPPGATPAGAAGPQAGIGNQGAYDPAYLQSAYNAPSHAGVAVASELFALPAFVRPPVWTIVSQTCLPVWASSATM